MGERINTNINKINRNEIKRYGRSIQGTIIEQRFSNEDRFSLLVDLEHSRRKSNKLQCLIQTATFLNSNACIEDMEYHEDRRLDKGLILKLASGTYIQESHNIIGYKNRYSFPEELKSKLLNVYGKEPLVALE
ncbi:ATP-binding protein [Paenibacillus crassostreae]|uniref:ATP-binding protein n=1 Tax=Paenibacillus crassostreae TaxID=1763538 RepID=UPI001E2A05D1|nr:ATP-binding protein [Paenibacillus crassostreae]